MSLLPRRLTRRLSLLTLCLLSLPTLAQPAFPSKPIKLIVPFAAGGSTDLVARVLAERMRQELGQAVVVDNRSGAGGMMGTEAVAQAAPDGYTIGMATVSTLAVNPIFYDKAAATNRQLLPLAKLVSMPSVYSVHPSLPAKDFAGFVAELRRKPGGYSAGVPGVGSIGHLMLEAFNDTLGVKVVNVPYRGMGAALSDALAGTIQLLPDQLPSALPQIRAGKLVPVAVAAPKRLPELPQVPTLKELGYAELNELGITWFGLVVPAKTPPAVAERLRAAALKAVQSPEAQARLQQMGASVDAGSSDGGSFQALIDTQLRRNRAIVQKADIKVE
ncbi:tripartite tricarboxylate transporter substrate-binding protein [Ramlibacter sp. 2FC]|uniref:tripartite tricarboxylate transporter substrate-binding protein n=1 Tax=Ramlibacter sp. 2FC TaxID=2502188 RepID=UPI0010F77F88|nr:tripartite tricarboxylate transporter substrate-binding protein [Ramlibacter sp. 2FC]